jgi:hypothetical protein
LMRIYKLELQPNQSLLHSPFQEVIVEK